MKRLTGPYMAYKVTFPAPAYAHGVGLTKDAAIRGISSYLVKYVEANIEEMSPREARKARKAVRQLPSKPAEVRHEQA